MARTRFAKILSDRRKQLRLSIPQAAKVLRMRETVLEAFEEGDFDHLPALGYAQGMVASYARYLGLDSRMVTELYEQEHEEYVSEVTGRDTFGLARLADEPANKGPASAASAPRPSRALPAARGGGVNLPSDGYASRPSGAAAAIPTYATPYRSEGPVPYSEQGGSYRQRGESVRSSRDDGRPYSGRQGERRYTTRVPESDEAARRRQAASARRARSADEGYGSRGRVDRYGQGPDDVTTRRVSSGQYRDDMRYDDGVRPYRPSSTRAGRQGGRGAQPPERPNVRRRQAPPAERDPRARSRRREPQRSGIAGVVQSLSSNPRNVMILIGVLLAVVLVLILVLSIRSCASNAGEKNAVPVVTASTATTPAATTASAAEQRALSDAAARAAASSAAAASQETVVKVSVADGATSWVEITSDGQQEVAESVTGAWEQEYTVKKSISISVADASVVTVEKNGQRVQLSKTSGGLASVTIEGTDPSASTASTDEATASGDSDSANSSSSNSKGSSSSKSSDSSSSSGSSSKSNSGSSSSSSGSKSSSSKSSN